MFHLYDPAMAEQARGRAQQLRQQALDHAWWAAHAESRRLGQRLLAALSAWLRPHLNLRKEA